MRRSHRIVRHGAATALFVLALASAADVRAQDPSDPVTPPRPFLPIPTAAQLDWQRDELRLFVHFGVNTFSDREWGTGSEDPASFVPRDLDPAQWARVAARNGFRAIVLTAKHHDGFALWPTRYSRHSVASSPWLDGRGDVVESLALAVRAHGLKLGLYLSPWDRHEPSYGDGEAYNAFYLGQLRELLTRYGRVHEVWFDGAKGEDARDMEYDFAAYWATVRQLQPEAVIFSDAGPDVRWIGNEAGFAGETNWSTYDRSKVGVGMHGIQAYLNTGERGAPDWTPGECDVSIRPGWFYHPQERPKTLARLLEIYYGSVGRNCLLLLNVPPNPAGRFDEADVAALDSLGAAVRTVFGRNLAEGATVEASSVRGASPRFGGDATLDADPDTFWASDPGAEGHALTYRFAEPVRFNVVRLQEPVHLGQRVAAYRVEAWVDGSWREIARGTTVGHKKLDRLPGPVTTTAMRVTVDDALETPLLSEFGLHFDPWAPGATP